MVFVPEIYPSKRSSSDEIEMLSNFKNTLTGQIKTTRCDSDLNYKRLFSDYLTSLGEQPSYELSQLEKHAPIYISENENPVLLDGNTFSLNVGLFGGAIAFDTPNYTDGEFYAETEKGSRAYLLVHDNTFKKN